MLRPDEAPDHARHDESAHQIACPDMHLKHVFLGQEVGDGEGDDQGPMEDPHERVPDIDFALSLRLDLNCP